MEGQKRTIKQGKNKTQISLGYVGGGIGGVLVLGGTLAVASLIAVFSFRNRRNDANDNPSGVSQESKNKFICKKQDEKREGLRFLSQTSCNETVNVNITESDPKELASTKSFILEENSFGGPQEILLSDDSKPESVSSWDDCGGVIQESSFQSVEINILSEETNGMKAIEDEKEGAVAVHAEERGVPEYLQIQPVEEEKYDEDEGEDVKCAVEEGEEDLESTGDSIMDSNPEAVIEDEKEGVVLQIPLAGEEEKDDEDEGVEEVCAEEEEEGEESTGDSSMESNPEAIWPAELIEETSQELKKSITISQNSLQKTVEEDYKIVGTEEYSYFDSSNNDDFFSHGGDENETNEKPTMILKETTGKLLRISIMSMLLVMLLLVLLSLNQHEAMSYYFLKS